MVVLPGNRRGRSGPAPDAVELAGQRSPQKRLDVDVDEDGGVVRGSVLGISDVRVDRPLGRRVNCLWSAPQAASLLVGRPSRVAPRREHPGVPGTRGRHADA